MTDEFFVAVKHFNLSWDEITQLSKNSISFGFLDQHSKQELLSTFDKNITEFESDFIKKREKSLKKDPKFNQFILTQYPAVAD